MGASRLRWISLALAALANAAAYYNYDAIAPVAHLLRDQRGLDDASIGLLNAVYSLPNIPLSLVGGVLIDRIGAGRAIVLAAALCCAGAILTALGQPFAAMVGGRLVFGVGSETLYIAVLVGIARWFGTGPAALATALFFSCARLGSWAADTSPHWAAGVYGSGWQAPLWLGASLTALGLVAALLCARIDAAMPATPAAHGERFSFSDMRGFDPAFWFILWINVLFASVFFPFRSTFSIAYFQDARGLTLAQAGIANGWVFVAAIVATPLVGALADRHGRRATLLLLGAALLPVAFALLTLHLGGLIAVTLLMGTSFSVIPAVIWPATAMLVEPRRLGTAYGLVNLLQSLGLALSNLAAGLLNDHFHAGPAHPAGYDAMLGWFAGLSLVTLGFALLLWWRERSPAAHGLERAFQDIS